MAHLYLIAPVLFLLLNVNKLYAETLFPFFYNKLEFSILLVGMGFVFIILIFFLIYHIFKLKRDNAFCLYLNLENIWNSVSILEAREKASSFISSEILDSEDGKGKKTLYYTGIIADFFNHIGLQVYQNIIDFSHIYYLFGQDIINYWENKNYKLLVLNEKRRSYPMDIYPLAGFEYLSQKCIQQRNYLRDIQTSKDLSPAAAKSSIMPNICLIIFSFLAFMSLFVFLFSYLFYHGYI